MTCSLRGGGRFLLVRALEHRVQVSARRAWLLQDATPGLPDELGVLAHHIGTIATHESDLQALTLSPQLFWQVTDSNFLRRDDNGH